MSLLMKTEIENDTHTQAREEEYQKIARLNDELTLLMKTSNKQISPMADDMKKKKRAESASLGELFQNTVAENGELEALKATWTADDEMEVEGISQMTLNSFILRAEELGKNITYTRTLKVEITD